MTKSPAAVEIRSLSRTFGKHKALDQVSLDIPQGVVLGLVGQNGAGKTTLIHHILGLLRAEEGDVRVFDLDPVQAPQQVLAKIGTLSEERDLPGWMRVEQLLNYTRAFYPTWDDALAQDLCSQFELNSVQKISTLSRGQHVRVGLVLALAPRPPLLVLDEPSSGLDPVVRRDVLQTVLRVAVAERRTVLFSSHLLDEVERISDHLALLEAGSLRFSGPLDDVLSMHRRLTVDSVSLPPLSDSRLDAAGPADILQATVVGRETHVLFRGDVSAAESLFAHNEVRICDEGEASLEEIFHAYTSSRRAHVEPEASL